jgi:LPXTG-motif cell wall-anchored protein
MYRLQPWQIALIVAGIALAALAGWMFFKGKGA